MQTRVVRIMKTKTAETANFTIYIAGDFEQAKQICREYCMGVGLCVTVDRTTYIYTGGEESGVRVGLINYPRFPAAATSLREKALGLAEQLMIGLCQHSYTVVGPGRTEWFSRRPA